MSHNIAPEFDIFLMLQKQNLSLAKPNFVLYSGPQQKRKQCSHNFKPISVTLTKWA